MTATIGEHAMLSDCRSAALVTAGGAVDWWPAPRFDSPSAFSALLGDGAGHWTVQPEGEFESEQRYRPGTLVLETTFHAASGTLRLTDALAFAPGARGHEIGREVPHALVRTAEALAGEVALRMECVPRLEYGLTVPRLSEIEGGAATTGGAERLFLRGSGPLRLERGQASAALTLEQGERAGWTLQRVPGMYADAPPPLDPDETIEDATLAWRSWAGRHAGYDGLHREAVHRAAIVVQGLTYQPTGAVVAAATTSLPEVPGGGDNFDYRFGWLRDAAMIARALSASTCSDEAGRYFDWMARAAAGCQDADHVQIVFGVEGERDLTEHALEHLPGHRGARPVRIGNAAWRQKQLDVLGHVLDCAWVIRDELDSPDPATGAFLCDLAERAARDWGDADSSIWEGRDGERDYVVSKVMCWVALDRAVRLAGRLGPHARPRAWAAARDKLREVVLREAWHAERGVFGGAFGSEHLDAGVLMLPLVGFIDVHDPRMTRTIDALEAELGDGSGLLQRWTGAEDGAFLLASFWLAECHARAGRLDHAHAVFERAAGAANAVGLLAEEVDPRTGEPLGNVPQAIAHVGLVNAAAALTEAEQGKAAA